jgi:hypothetical protein
VYPSSLVHRDVLLKNATVEVDNPTGADFLSGKTQFKTLPLRAQIAVAVFGLVGVIVLFSALGTRPSAQGGTFYLMLAIAMVTARVKVRLLGGSTLSPLTSVVLATLMVLGPRRLSSLAWLAW